MTTVSGAAAVLVGIDLGAPPTGLRHFHTGLTNRSYRFELNGRPQVLRLDTGNAATLGMDRSREFAILERASAAGLAPEVRYADATAGVLVYAWLPGRPRAAGDLADGETLASIAGLLRAVHELPTCGSALDVAAAARRYAGITRADASLHAFADKCVAIVTATPPGERARCCHNDIVAGNLIGNGKLRLIDWEFACDNDSLFDLASLIGYHDLDAESAATLLAAYCGKRPGEERERLALQCRLFDALQWLWLAAEQVLRPSPRRLERLVQLGRRIA